MNSNPRFGPLASSALLVCLLGGTISLKAQPASWSFTGSLSTPRPGHTATLLANGKVLAVGGDGASTSAELYDPATGQWSATGGPSSPRIGHMAVRLPNGKVLVVGGNRATSELYDPDTGTWSAAGDLKIVPATAVLLADGRVLAIGGSTSELYDPATGAWSQTGSLNVSRSYHKATLLPDGKVLVTGGFPNSRSAELYDPVTGRWTATGSLIAGHSWDFQVVLLPNGKVLVFGGGISGDDFCNGVHDAELYDSETGQWSPTDSAISTHNDYYDYSYTTVLPNGKMLVVGGAGPGCDALKSAELYDPATGSWSVTASLNTARYGHTVTLLANGKVLVVGGDGTSTELFDSGTPTVTSVSAASFSADRTLAPESIGSAFGKNLAISAQTAVSFPRPTELAGVRVRVRDRVGVERMAPLLYVSAELINFVVPSGTALGLATLTVTIGDSFVAAGLVEIAGVAPGLFTANSTGRGLAAGFWTRVAEGGAQSVDNLRESVPVDLGAPGDQLFLSLYGTGFRGGASATATVGGAGVPVSAFAAVTDYQGLDIVTIGPLPRALIGRGEVDVAVSVDGKAANLVTVNIR